MLALAAVTLVGCAAGPALQPADLLARPIDRPALPAEVTRIFVGSCLHQDKPQRALETAVARTPDLALLLGDNVYADADDVGTLEVRYRRQLSNPAVQKLLASVPLLATWDDHDYGLDDSGADNPLRAKSKQMFLSAWDPDASPERRDHDGIYDAVMLGPPERSVQVLLLDTRTFRSTPRRDPRWVAPVNGRGPYLPTQDDDATILGEEQWEWLEDELARPARVRIIASSIQVLAQQHGWESWRNFPAEYDRLLALLSRAGGDQIVIVSGDRHLAEISAVSLGDGRRLYDLTTSSLNSPLIKILRALPNEHRIGRVFLDANFGEVDIDWSGAAPTVTLRVLDAAGAVRLQEQTRQR